MKFLYISRNRVKVIKTFTVHSEPNSLKIIKINRTFYKRKFFSTKIINTQLNTVHWLGVHAKIGQYTSYNIMFYGLGIV